MSDQTNAAALNIAMQIVLPKENETPLQRADQIALVAARIISSLDRRMAKSTHEK